MIKLGQYIRINPLVIPLFLICFNTGQGKILLISYITILLHEIAHLVAACFLGLRSDTITFHPFGVNLQLKNKIVFKLSDEIILYGAGPAFNIICACAISFFKLHSNIWDYFYTCNVVLFVINILPILPLDGGIIVKKVLTHIFDFRIAQNILLFLSVIFILTIFSVEIISSYNSGINYSVIMMLFFLIGNIFTQREKYNIDFINELMFYQKKKYGKGEIIIVSENSDYKTVAKRFKKNNYSIIMTINEDGEISKILTETQIINQLLE